MKIVLSYFFMASIFVYVEPNRGASHFKKSVKNIVESQRFCEKSMESQKIAWSRRESEKMRGVKGSRKKTHGVAGSRKKCMESQRIFGVLRSCGE